ncbi:hybrid sensor histidine kinase/response regulator [Segnochrobactrum spirostomi]|uniref:histidine kinase n=1 Tax=Segnochrobactrum spirostomi TaxID=2608987 RepID=A0A6A7Y8A2_9HYPH|nr:hybrid sensor histidine kinase/response regulator [Segnochrobactrum spirostomi]MQT14218.1 response regulator [Segnochrobactrum spirostomi]
MDQMHAWRVALKTNRSVRLLAVLGLALVVIVPLVTAIIIVQLRREEVRGASRELTTLDLLLTEETTRAFQSVDLVLDAIAENAIGTGAHAPDDYVARSGTREMHEFLKAKLTGIPQLDAITMIAADGHLINFSRYFPIPSVNVSDRDYFKYLKEHDTTAPFMSEPVRNRGTGTWTIYLARRVSAPDGTFLGLVLGAIELDYFDRLYRSLGLIDGTAIALWRTDGVLLAHFPPLPEGTGTRYSMRMSASVTPDKDVQVFRTHENSPFGARLVATRVASDLPIAVNISQTMETVLADWRRQSWVIGVSGGACLVAALFLLWAFARRIRAYDAVAAAMAERHQAIVAREEMERRLLESQKLEAIGQLTGGVAHDFNNLLAVILGNLEMLRRHVGGDSKGIHYLDNAMRGVERGAALTQRMLAFARRQELRPGAVDLVALVQGMQDLLRRSIGPSISIELRFPSILPPANVDANQLELALVNLSVNARDAMPNGGTLFVSATRRVVPPGRDDGLAAGEYVCLAVRDTGTGMDEETLRRAAEPFFTTKGIGKGTGLGLSMVHGLAAQSGGRLVLKSTPGEGTTAEIWLPVAAAEQPQTLAARAGATAPEDGDEVSDFARLRILLVDDDPLVLTGTREMLEGLDHVVLPAANAEEAMRRLTAGEAVDLVISDHAMPGMTGATLALEIHKRWPHMPILIATGYAEIMDEERYDLPRLRKPFRRRDLAAAIAETISANEPSDTRAAS